MHGSWQLDSCTLLAPCIMTFSADGPTWDFILVGFHSSRCRVNLDDLFVMWFHCNSRSSQSCASHNSRTTPTTEGTGSAGQKLSENSLKTGNYCHETGRRGARSHRQVSHARAPLPLPESELRGTEVTPRTSPPRPRPTPHARGAGQRGHRPPEGGNERALRGWLGIANEAKSMKSDGRSPLAPKPVLQVCQKSLSSLGAPRPFNPRTQPTRGPPVRETDRWRATAR